MAPTRVPSRIDFVGARERELSKVHNTETWLEVRLEFAVAEGGATLESTASVEYSRIFLVRDGLSSKRASEGPDHGSLLLQWRDLELERCMRLTVWRPSTVR